MDPGDTSTETQQTLSHFVSDESSTGNAMPATGASSLSATDHTTLNATTTTETSVEASWVRAPRERVLGSPARDRMSFQGSSRDAASIRQTSAPPRAKARSESPSLPRTPPRRSSRTNWDVMPEETSQQASFISPTVGSAF